MKSLFSFSSGGGSGFPGAPVAGVYVAATSGEFLAICAQVVTVPYSTVVDGASGGLTWYATGADMGLLGGSVIETANLPTPGTVDGVTFVINSDVAIYNQFDEEFYTFDGASWNMIG